ncbi:MAG TPA: bacteriohopanetetrol glucosamine biosynthesis glycosyltransferase HpnI [Sphingomonadaceae bacterium]|nr:bacteriohopanetetrol glucosamine biosynthesis glycosyltransferase HpnI [Sphingomonadaceae bacterium]
MTGVLGFLFLALSFAGIVYTLAAALLAGRYRAIAPPLPREAPALTVLKPLHGDEPALATNLASFVDQTYPGPVQMVCGVQHSDDPAIDTVHALRDARKDRDILLVVDPARHGANGKISNLVNMTRHARHPLLILSDSDMAAPPDYLATIVAALNRPGIGAVTCLYHGRGQAGGWSRIAAAGISYQFLPSVIVGIALGRAQPCMGSTIALRRATLDRIGGFANFADLLADDHAIGEAVRALGLAVAVPPLILAHGCAEASLGALVRHELRWAATIRGLDRAGYAGSVVTYPVPLALLGLAIAGLSAPAAAIAGLALLARLGLAWRIDQLTGERAMSLWLLPARDILAFAIFVAGFFARAVDWRGSGFRMEKDGRIAARSESLT